jgi:hypothetical protein
MGGHKPQRRNIDTELARNRIKAIHLVARYGGQGTPDEDDIKTARRALLKTTPDYTAELVWNMSKYRSCRHGDLVALLASPTMRKHIVSHRERIDELLHGMPVAAAGREHCDPSGLET